MLTPHWVLVVTGWLIVVTGLLAVLAMLFWLATDALRRILLCAGLWRDFFVWMLERRYRRRATLTPEESRHE